MSVQILTAVNVLQPETTMTRCAVQHMWVYWFGTGGVLVRALENLTTGYGWVMGILGSLRIQGLVLSGTAVNSVIGCLHNFTLMAVEERDMKPLIVKRNHLLLISTRNWGYLVILTTWEYSCTAVHWHHCRSGLILPHHALDLPHHVCTVALTDADSLWNFVLQKNTKVWF